MSHATRRTRPLPTAAAAALVGSWLAAAALLGGCSASSAPHVPYQPPTLPMCEAPLEREFPAAFVLSAPVTWIEIAPPFDPQRLPEGSRWRVRAELQASHGFALVFEPQHACPDGPCQSYDVVELDELPAGATFEDGAQLVERVGERVVIEVDASTPPGRLLAVRTDTTDTDVHLQGTVTVELESTAPVPCTTLEAPRVRPTAVAAVCGNGLIEQDEACDDANVHDRDGCSAACQVEPAMCAADAPGWVIADCQGAPSTCTLQTCTLDSAEPACVASRGHLVLDGELAAPGRATVDATAVEVTLDGRPLDCHPHPGVRANACRVPVAPCGTAELAVGGADLTLSCGQDDAARCALALGSGEQVVRVAWTGAQGGVEAVQRDVTVSDSVEHPDGGLVTSTFVRPELEYRLQRWVPGASATLEESWSLWTGDGYLGQPMGFTLAADGTSHVVVERYAEPGEDGVRARLPAELWRVDPEGDVAWRLELTERELRSVAVVAVDPSGARVVVSALTVVGGTYPDETFERQTWHVDAQTGQLLETRTSSATGRLDDARFLPDGTLLRASVGLPVDPDIAWLDVPGLARALPEGTTHEALATRLERVDLASGEVMWARQWLSTAQRPPLQLAGVSDDGAIAWVDLMLEAGDDDTWSGGTPHLVVVDTDGRTRWSVPLASPAGCRASPGAVLDPATNDLVVASSHACEQSLDTVIVERLALDGATRWVERIDATDDPGNYPDAWLTAHSVFVDRATGRVLVAASQRLVPSHSSSGRLLVLSP